MSKAIMLDEMGPGAGRFADPTDVGVRIEDIKIANEGGKRGGRCNDAMACLARDFIEHVDEIKEEDDKGGDMWVC